MPRPLSNDLRERIVRAVEGGMSRNAAAEKFEVSISSAVKIMQLWKRTGSWLPHKVGGHQRHILLPHEEEVNRILKEKPDITVAEMRVRLAKLKIKASESAITRFLIHIGQSYKKNGSRQRAGQARRSGRAQGAQKSSPRVLKRGVRRISQKLGVFHLSGGCSRYNILRIPPPQWFHVTKVITAKLFSER
ncbi:MAG: transposase [Alphaproteobacteria bacterium]|nr:MAG: transposase [Alphaproteobacteria bacterium]